VLKFLPASAFSFTVGSNSDLMAAGVPENVSGWTYVRTLGSGGFGAVYLYRSEVSFGVLHLGGRALFCLVFC